MRAFTILFAGAMFGAVSLAAAGAISTIAHTRHDAAAFSLAGSVAPVRASQSFGRDDDAGR